jgi:hypothetical protein
MFPRMNITTPLPSFAYCPPQYSAGVGFGGINPVVPYMANPYLSSPAAIPYSGIGQSPYASPFIGSPASIPYPGIGQSPYASPFIGSPAAIPYPGIGSSPYASPFIGSPAAMPYPGIGQSPYAMQPGLPFPAGPFSAGISPISPWYSPFSWSPYAFAPPTPAYPAIHPALAGFASSIFSSPATYIDPATGTIVPHPHQAAQSVLPIRPLITAHTDPVQMAALCGMMAAPMVDPYSVMTSTPSPMSVMGAVPPVMRSPLYMSPIGPSPVGVPCAVAPGIPC